MTPPPGTGTKPKGKALNNAACKQDNGAAAGGTVLPCEWLLRVHLRSVEPIWPKVPVDVIAERVAGAGGPKAISVPMTLSSAANKAVDYQKASGSPTYRLRATTAEKGWSVVAMPQVSLAPSKTETTILEVKCPLLVWLALKYKDPKGVEKVFPPDLPVTVLYDDNATLDLTVGKDGLIKFEIPRTKKWFTLRIAKSMKYIASAPDGSADPKPEQFSTESEATDLGKKGFRFFLLPDTDWGLRESDWTLTGGPVGLFSEKWKFDLGADNDQIRNIGAEDAPLKMLLDPHWQFLRFEFADRYYVHSNHGDKRVNIPPVPVRGYAVDPALPTSADPPQTRAQWVLDEKVVDDARHCVPWIIQKDAGGVVKAKPDEKIGLLFDTTANSYVVSTSENDRKIEVIPANDARMKPAVGRLKLYDLPEHWRSTNYFARQADDTGEFFKPIAGFKARVTKSLTLATPLIFSLDDIVLTGADLKQLPLAGTDTVSVFHHQFTDPAPGAPKPVTKYGLHNPGTTIDPKGYPYSDLTLTDRYYISEVPKWTRLVIAGGNLYDVFAQRTAAVAGNNVIGARAAVRWLDAVALAAPGTALLPRPGLSEFPTAAPANAYFAVQPYYDQEFLSRTMPPQATAGVVDEWAAPIATNPPGPTYWHPRSPIGRFDIVHLRCCDYDGTKEIGVVIRYHRYNFDFAAKPNTLQAQPAAAQNAWIQGVCDGVTNRWNGDDAHNTARSWVEARGAAPLLKSQVVTFVQYLATAQSHFKIDLIAENKVSNMGYTGAGELRPLAGAELVTRGFPAAHETGHAGGLPDEYAEYSDGQLGFGSNNLLGSPYILEDWGMMFFNRYIRARYLWYVAEWLRTTTAVGAVDLKVVHDTEDFQLPHYHHATRRRHWVHWPVRLGLRARGSGTGCFDAHLYLLGNDAYASVRLPALAGGGTFDGMLTVFVRVRYTIAGALNTDPIRQTLYTQVHSSVDNTVNATRRVADFTVAAPGPPALARCFVNIAERYLSGAANASAPAHLEVTATIRTAGQATALIDVRAQPQLQVIAAKYNAMPQPLTAALATARTGEENAARTAAAALPLPDAPAATQAVVGGPWAQTIDLPANLTALPPAEKADEEDRFGRAVAAAIVNALGLTNTASGQPNSFRDAASYKSIVRSVMDVASADPNVV